MHAPLHTVALAMVMIAAPRAQDAQEPVQVTGAMQRAIDALFSHFNHDTPGAALAVGLDGEVLYSQGYGMANLEYDIPIRPHSVFHVASVSKQFTAMAIALLHDESVLSVDDEVRVHIGELHDFGPRLTIRHLAHHTSGLRDQWELLGMAGWRGDDVKTQQDVLDLVSQQRELNFEPGAEYLYCNTGYTLMAEIVRRASGASLKEFAAARIFTPLGMATTHFHDDTGHIVRNRAYAYRPRPGGFSISIPDFETYGATSLFTTVEDLVRWADNFRHGRVGGAPALELMRTRGVLADGERIAYAFGLSHGDHRGLPTLGHSGSDAGYRAQLTMYPGQGLAIAVLSNVSNGNPGGLARQVAEVVLEEVFPEPVAEASGASRGGRRGGRRGSGRGGSREGPAGAPGDLEPFAGDYYSAELDATYRIATGAEGLVLQRRRFADRPMGFRGPDAFSAGSWRLAFQRDASGRVTGFTLTSGRVRNLAFTRR